MPCTMKNIATAIKGTIIPVLLMVSLNVDAQQSPGSIHGTVTNAETGEPLFQIVLELISDSTVVQRVSTDFDGEYEFTSLEPKMYDIRARGGISMSDKEIHNVSVSSGSPTELSFTMETISSTIGEIVITWEAPLVDEERTGNTTTISNESIARVATRGTASLSSLASGVAVQDAGAPAARGTRSDPDVVFIDGVKVRGNGSIPTQTEEYNSIETNPRVSPADEPQSTFGMDVDRASYFNVKRMIEYGQYIPRDAVRVEEFINSFQYEAAQPEDGEVFGVTSELSECSWNDDHHVLRLTLNTDQVDLADLPPSSYVFLVDVSGSMNSSDKLPLVKETLRILTNNLRDEDRVSIVTYAGSVSLVLPSTSGENKDEILAAIERLHSGGSTNGAGGIQLAYREAEENFIRRGNNRVILCTDGDFNVGVSSQSELIEMIEEKRETGVFLSVIGYGQGNYREGTMEQLANKGNGNMNYIKDLYDARRIMQSEFISTLFTVAKDAKIQVEFNPNVVSEYRLIGYENRLMAAQDFDNDSIDGGEVGMGHQVTAIYEITLGEAESERDLRYQSAMNTNIQTDEIAFLSIRYKEPDGDESSEFNHIISNTVVDEPSQDQRFAMAVASFAGTLRNDVSMQMNVEDIIIVAQETKGEDLDGMRSDFIQLAQLYRDLTAQNN